MNSITFYPLIILLFATQVCAQNPTHEWAKTFGGSYNINGDRGRDITTDVDGNVLTVGTMYGAWDGTSIADLDPSSATNIYSIVGAEDVFIQKLDSSGNFLWARAFGGKNGDFAEAVFTDATGNVFVTGSVGSNWSSYASDTINLNPDSAGVDIHITNGRGDAFVEKLDANGNFVWAKTFGSADNDGANDVWVDAAGNVYVLGWFQDTVDFDPGVGTDIRISNGNTDIYLLKLDANGDFLWVKTLGGSSADYAPSFATDVSGNLYLTGYFQDTIDFDSGTGTNIHISNGANDAFVLKLDNNGDFVWVTTWGGNGSDASYYIALDTAENLYLTGQFRDTVDFDSGAGTDIHVSNGGADVFVQKLDANGNFVWAKTFGATNQWDYSTGITVLSDGGLYISGRFQDTLDFDPSNGTDIHSSTGSFDIFISKFDINGNFLWVLPLGGIPSSGNGFQDEAYGITSDSKGYIYSTGYFHGTLDFDPSSGTDINTGSLDVFVLKFKDNGTVLTNITTELVNKDVTIYPNPSSNILSINSNGINIMEVRVVDVNGRFLKRLNGTDRLDISDLATGLYILSIKTSKGLINKRFVKK
jgi:hypothetical protein